MNIFERCRNKFNLYKRPVQIFTGSLFVILAAMFYKQGQVDVVDGPVLTPITAYEYRLVQDFCVTAAVPPYVYVITVKSNFVTDGASIPTIALTPFGLTPFSPTIIAAAVVHDWLYQSERLPREISDAIFNVVMLARGTEPHKAESAYICVQAGGSVIWSNHTPESIAAALPYGVVQIVTQ